MRLGRARAAAPPDLAGAFAAPPAGRRRPLIARSLGWFWGAVGLGLVAGAVTLQTLGPPERTRPAVLSPPPAVEVISPRPTEAKLAAGDQTKPGRATPGPIASPDPALLEASPRDAAAAEPAPAGAEATKPHAEATAPRGDPVLPRISPDGRAPMAVYARGFDRSNRRPRIGLLFAGFGPNLADSEEAIRALPGAVTLGFSPYASHLKPLLDLARLTGHEFLVSIPMEPQGYPQNDAGDHALLTTVNSAVNEVALDWTLARMQGYVGGTGALGPLRGERFAAATGPMDAMLRALASRGLLYVDPRPGSAPMPYAWGRTADVVVDEPPVRSEIDAKLAQLETIARERGSALGLAMVLRPVTIGRLLAWSTALQDRGFALAPVSALVHAPPAPEAAAEGH